jgi:protein involved in polysaccharide export with SLBB domain
MLESAGELPWKRQSKQYYAGQAADEIERRLIAAGIMHPQVTVRVDAYATQNASVMGQVMKPGLYEIDTRRKVIDVLALAGGLTDVADRHITIERHGDPNQKIDYYYSNVAGTARVTRWSTRRHSGRPQSCSRLCAWRCLEAGRVHSEHQ